MKRYILFILPYVLIGVRGFCDEPDVPEHSFIFMTSPDINGNNYDEGTQIRYRCDKYYHLWGNPVRTCEQNGRWTSINFKCNEITCGYIAPPENGRVKNAPTYKTGTFMEFECNEGFRITGSQRYLCGVDGDWRYGLPAKCEHVYCRELSPIENGEIFQDTYDGIRNNYGSEAEYTCRRGYRVFGTMDEYTRICGADGKWSGAVPYCEAPQCDEIPTYNGGTVKYHGNRRRNTKVVLRCDPGYSMYPDQRMILTCKRITETIYRWEPEPSFCYKKQVIDIPDNCETSTTNKELLHEESYHLSAKHGYEFKQNNQYLDINRNIIQITNNNGTLEPTPPQCKPARCSTTNRNDMYVYFLNETRANDKVESGSNYKFMCPMNYEFQDEEYLKTRFIILRCYLGQFENIPTTCVARRCRLNNDDIALRIGTTKLSVIEHNQQVHVKCKSTRHELYNPETGEYQEPFYVWCVYGKFQNFVNELKCLPKRCDTSQLKNIRVSDLNSVQTDKFVEGDNEYLLRCNFNYEFMEYPEKEYIKKRCNYGNFESVSSCVPKKCRLRNDDIILLDRGEWNIQDVNHNNEVHVKCKSTRHELYNPETGEYQEPFSVRCNYGKFLEFVNELECLPKRCDTSQLKNIRVSDLNSVKTDKFVESDNEYLLRCNFNYEFMEYPEKEYIKKRCNYGNFERVSPCVPKKCRLSNNDIEVHFGNMKSQDINHNSQGRVKCKLLTYELYNPGTGDYKEPFDVSCNYGKFSEVVNELRCRPKRCDTTQLQHTQVLYLNYSSTDKFVESSFRYRLRCESKYEFAERHIDSIISVCERGEFNDVSPCLPKSCTVAFPDSNTHYRYNDDNAAIGNGTVVPHDTEVNASCIPQYELYMDKFLSETFHSARCEYGVLKLPQCVEKRCRISPLEGFCYKRKISMSECINRTFHFRHQRNITLTCEANYSLFWKNSSGEIMSEEPAVLVCDKGTVYERYRCSPDPCPIPSLFNASTNYTHEEVKTGDQVTFICNEGHHIQNTVNDTIWTGECKAGSFKDLPNGCVPDICDLTDVRNGHYIQVDSGEAVSRIGDGESVQLKCFDGFYIVNSRNEIISTNVPSIYCDKGFLSNNRHQCKKCKNGNETRQSISNTDRSLTTFSVGNNIMHCEEYDNSGNDDHVKIPKPDVIRTATDCVIKESSVYKYSDKNGKELQPLEDTIQNGDMINVECFSSEDYYYYDYGYDDIEDNSEEELYTVTCINGTLTPVNLVCREESIGHNEPCNDMRILNGTVTRFGSLLDKYTVKCDSGFNLNVRTEVPCSCDSGQIKCAAGEIPRCREANCTLPPNFDRRLTLSRYENGKQWYLGGESVVKPREQVVFNCSKVIDQIYEPFNRIFECRYGKWIAADEKNWSFEYNGTFPECRKSECNPPCENNGICYKDDTCRCGEWYKGSRCEIVLCPEDCTRNSGTCDKSGSCVCPSGRHGKNCENRDCKLPEGAAEHKEKRTVFAGSESIFEESMICPKDHRKSAPHMTCLNNNGSWTNVISCLRTNFKYVVSMSIADQNHASTHDNVYVKIIGKDRTTREFIMPTANKGKLKEINFEDIDVTPIEKVVIRKDKTLLYDDNALIYYVSIFVEESDEYYMFKDRHSENKWLKTNAPKTFTIAAHPEPCRHTYGSAVNRSPKQRSTIKKYTSVRGCKQYCVTCEKIKCASVHFMPRKRTIMGFCYLHEVSAFSNSYFRNNYLPETDAGYVSYNRICLMK